ncbi:hypothetical protein HG530_004890 [Fusarium avenaceum]|nr:hypothetical protein HG530_004890 [Fusarium avenaceum]
MDLIVDFGWLSTQHNNWRRGGYWFPNGCEKSIDIQPGIPDGLQKTLLDFLDLIGKIIKSDFIIVRIETLLISLSDLLSQLFPFLTQHSIILNRAGEFSNSRSLSLQTLLLNLDLCALRLRPSFVYCLCKFLPVLLNELVDELAPFGQ